MKLKKFTGKSTAVPKLNDIVNVLNSGDLESGFIGNVDRRGNASPLVYYGKIKEAHTGDMNFGWVEQGINSIGQWVDVSGGHDIDSTDPARVRDLAGYHLPANIIVKIERLNGSGAMMASQVGASMIPFKILSHTPATGSVWNYTAIEQTRNFSIFNDRAGAPASTIISAINENGQTGTILNGGVDMGGVDFPSGFAAKPMQVGSIVLCAQIVVGYSVEYWFNHTTQVDGTCS